MRKLFAFEMVSLDGRYEGQNHDLSWHNAKNEEFDRLQAENLVSTDAILMGRRTFELMRTYWPTEQASADDPEMARFMNDTAKFVVSHDPYEPGWTNTASIHGDQAMEHVRQLKSQDGQDIVVLGSSNLCGSLLGARLMDQLRVMVNPVVLGVGTPLLDGLTERIGLRLISTRAYESGNVLLTYTPA